MRNSDRIGILAIVFGFWAYLQSGGNTMPELIRPLAPFLSLIFLFLMIALGISIIVHGRKPTPEARMLETLTL